MLDEVHEGEKVRGARGWRPERWNSGGGLRRRVAHCDRRRRAPAIDAFAPGERVARDRRQEEAARGDERQEGTAGLEGAGSAVFLPEPMAPSAGE